MSSMGRGKERVGVDGAAGVRGRGADASEAEEAAGEEERNAAARATRASAEVCRVGFDGSRRATACSSESRTSCKSKRPGQRLRTRLVSVFSRCRTHRLQHSYHREHLLQLLLDPSCSRCSITRVDGAKLRDNAEELRAQPVRCGDHGGRDATRCKGEGAAELVRVSVASLS